MSELDPEIRALLASARAADEPSDQDRQRVRSRLAAHVGAAALAAPVAKVAVVKGAGAAASATTTGGGAGAASAGASSAAASSTAAGASLAGAGAVTASGSAVGTGLAGAVGGAKLWVALGVAGVVGAVGADRMVPQEGAAARTAQVQAVAEPPVEKPVPRRMAPAEPYPELEIAPLVLDGEPEATQAPPQTAETLEAREPTRPSRRHRRPRARDAKPQAVEPTVAAPERADPDAAPAVADEPETQQGGDSEAAALSATLDAPTPPTAAPEPGTAADLQAELALLRRAQTALRGGLYASALQLARQHADRFPQGHLTRERLGVIALARCGNGQDGGEAARELTRAAPGSPLAERVRRACGSSTP